MPDASAKSLHLNFGIYHILSPKTKFRHIHNQKENDMCIYKRMINVDIGHKSASSQNQQVTKRY